MAPPGCKEGRREGRREGGRVGGREGGFFFLLEVGRYGCRFDGLGQLDTMGRKERGREGGRKGGRMRCK